MTSLRGPAGQLCDRGSFVGSPRSAPASLFGRTDEEPTLSVKKPDRLPYSWPSRHERRRYSRTSSASSARIRGRNPRPSSCRQRIQRKPIGGSFARRSRSFASCGPFIPPRAQLAMTAEEITDVLPSPDAYSPHRSAAAGRLQDRLACAAGPKSRPNGSTQADKYLAPMQDCIAVHFPNMDRARIKFMQKAVDLKLCASKKTARNHWYRLLPTLKINRPSN